MLSRLLHRRLQPMIEENGSYIFYGDESGDHSLVSIDPDFPVFALSLCGFKKSTYCSRTVPKFQRLKFQFFGHDAVVLHEHEIRKQLGPFVVLSDLSLRRRFMNNLSECLRTTQFRIFSCVISKNDLKMDLFPDNPYAIALSVCLQKAFLFLERKGEIGKRCYFIFEKRGKREDSELELEFRRIVAGSNELKAPFPGFQIHFSDKRTNSTGMQVADLTARPIALRAFRAQQTNRAYEIISRKIFKTKRFANQNLGIFG